jgi:hypothetical protein
MSIQERQKQLIEEKRKQQMQQAQMWDTLGSGRGTPELRVPSPGVAQKNEEDVDDILAAFNRAAPVDKASHYPPPPSGPASGRSTPAAAPAQSSASAAMGGFDDDDDPFGLAEIAKKNNGQPKPSTAPVMANEDDILGDLGRPVTERPTRQPSPRVSAPEWDENVASSRVAHATEPQDRALAEIIDMGFPEETAKIALAETGGDVQNAVGWLLQQAHEESKRNAKEESQTRRSPSSGSRGPSHRQRNDQEQVPSWMRQESRPASAARRQDSRSPAEGEKDAAKVAADLGNKLFKSANSIWKASQKQMAKTAMPASPNGCRKGQVVNRAGLAARDVKIRGALPKRRPTRRLCSMRHAKGFLNGLQSPSLVKHHKSLCPEAVMLYSSPNNAPRRSLDSWINSLKWTSDLLRSSVARK